MAWGGSWRYSQSGIYGGSGVLPGSPVDYEALAGDVMRNSVVSACAGWIADNVTEPNLTVWTRMPAAAGVTEQPDATHPLCELIRNPNPHYDGDALWQATAISYACHGNAYWLKVRGDRGRGATRELWWVPHWTITPRWSRAEDFISYYEYSAGGAAEPIKLAPSEVVHFRYGIDPDNPRLGMSRVRTVLREVVTDNEAAVYWAAVLRNLGIWGCVISPATEDGELPMGTGEVIRRQIFAQHTGEERGRPLVLTHPVRVDKTALDPGQLLPLELRVVPEARICSAFRIPPSVLSLTAGDRTKAFANYRQARRSAYEDCLMPMARRFAQSVESQMGPEFGLVRGAGRVGWDWREVAALREELTAIYNRNSVGVAGGWLTVNEARALAGLPPRADGDVYRLNVRPPRPVQDPSADGGANGS